MTISVQNNTSTQISINGYNSSFPVNVILTNVSSRNELDNIVHGLVKTPDTLAIGLDPTHHFVNIHYGKALNISQSSYADITHAGNANFKNGDFDNGILNIISSAQSARVFTSHTSAPNVVVQKQESHVGMWIFGILVFGIIFFILYTWYKNSQAWNNRRNRSTYDDYEPLSSGGTTIINNGGNNNSGFVDGMIVNELLHSHDHNCYHDHSSSYDSGSSSSDNDAGSSSGGWDSGSFGGGDSGGGGDW